MALALIRNFKYLFIAAYGGLEKLKVGIEGL
jgi:hypothetical protein